MLQHLKSGSIAVLLLLLAATAFQAHGADAGRIKSASGSVHIERGGDRIPAQIGTPVRAADTLVTGPDGSAGITFIDNSRMSAGPNSTLIIDRYAFDHATHTGVLDASLRRGTLAAVSGRLAKHSSAAVTVRTPTMVLGVRGTEFLVYAE